MNRLGGAVRKQLESRILAVLSEFIPVWTSQHKALDRIMDILDPGSDPSAQHEMEMALVDVLEWDPILQRGRLQKLASLLVAGHYKPGVIRDVYRKTPESPWGRCWQSQKGTQPPGEKALRDTVARLARGAGAEGVVDLDQA